MASFNIDGGYLEGLCRGFKCGILKQADYLNLVQCETLEGLYLQYALALLIRSCDAWKRKKNTAFPSTKHGNNDKMVRI